MPNFFSRIGDILSAKVNGVVDEMEDPIEMLDQKLRDMDNSLNEAKKASAEVLGNIHQTEKKLTEALARSADWDAKVRQAMSAGKEDLARQALQKKLEADKSCETLRTTYEAQKVNGEALKKRLRGLEDEVEKTRSYRSDAAARLAGADASQKVNEILANVETKSNHISMDRIERKISQKESVADGLGDIASMDSSLEAEFEALGAPNLDDELAKYRK